MSVHVSGRVRLQRDARCVRRPRAQMCTRSTKRAAYKSPRRADIRLQSLSVWISGSVRLLPEGAAYADLVAQAHGLSSIFSFGYQKAGHLLGKKNIIERRVFGATFTPAPWLDCAAPSWTQKFAIGTHEIIRWRRVSANRDSPPAAYRGAMFKKLAKPRQRRRPVGALLVPN